MFGAARLFLYTCLDPSSHGGTEGSEAEDRISLEGRDSVFESRTVSKAVMVWRRAVTQWTGNRKGRAKLSEFCTTFLHTRLKRKHSVYINRWRQAMLKPKRQRSEKYKKGKNQGGRSNSYLSLLMSLCMFLFEGEESLQNCKEELWTTKGPSRS